MGGGCGGCCAIGFPVVRGYFTRPFFTKAKVVAQDGVAIQCQLMTRGSRSRVCGLEGNELLVSLEVGFDAADANSSLVRFLAQALKVTTAQVSVVSGGSGRSKRVLVAAVRPQLVSMRLSPK